MSEVVSKFELIKFGVSEIKRKNLKQTYTFYCDWIKENENDSKDYDSIFNDWKEKEIYLEEKKEKNIERELSFLQKNKFAKIIKNINKKLMFKITDVSKNWDNNEYFFGLQGIDFSFFQFLLKQKFYNESNEKSSFFSIFSHLIKGKKISREILLSEEYKNYINKIVQENDYKSILNCIRYKSGSSKLKESATKDKLRNEVFEKFIEEYEENKNIYNLTLKSVEKYFDFLSENNFNKCSDGFLELIFDISLDKKNNLNLNKWKKNKNIFIEEAKRAIPVKSKINLIERIINRLTCGSYSSYKNLIVNHINCLSNIFYVENNNNFVVRNQEFEIVLKKIIADETKILLLKNDKFYSSKELIEHFDLNKYKWSITFDNCNDYIINNLYSLDKLNYILREINSCITNENKYNMKKIYEIIEKNEHIKGQANWPTFYEFIIGIIFLKKEYGFISSNWKEKMEKHLRLKFDGSLCPIRFASGGIADINFIYNDVILNVEPTTQLFRQNKMEYDSSISHLDNECKKSNKEIFGISIITAPILEDNFKYSIKGYNSNNIKKNRKIFLFDNESVLDYLNSNESFHQIKNKKQDEFLKDLNKLSKYDYIDK